MAAELVAMMALELALRDRYLGSEKVRRQKLNNETGLELLDSFVVEQITKGWSPRLFFDDLSKLQKGVNKQDRT